MQQLEGQRRSHEGDEGLAASRGGWKAIIKLYLSLFYAWQVDSSDLAAKAVEGAMQVMRLSALEAAGSLEVDRV